MRMPLSGVGEHVPKWLEQRETSVSQCSLDVNAGWQSEVGNLSVNALVRFTKPKCRRDREKGDTEG